MTTLRQTIITNLALIEARVLTFFEETETTLVN